MKWILRHQWISFRRSPSFEKDIGIKIFLSLLGFLVLLNLIFVSANLNNFLWATFTRANPSHDIHGIQAFSEYKHWGCRGPLIIDARIKPHHAPPLVSDPAVMKKVDKLFSKGGELAHI